MSRHRYTYIRTPIWWPMSIYSCVLGSAGVLPVHTMANGPTDADRNALRDMFAAAALTGLQAHHDYGQNGNEWIANEAYSLADAMLLARAGTNDTEPPAGDK